MTDCENPRCATWGCAKHDPPYAVPTRQWCQRCRHIVEVDFYSPIWEQVAGRHWQDSILCVRCFAEIGDEKHIAWEEGVEFEPCSYATQHAMRQGLADA